MSLSSSIRQRKKGRALASCLFVCLAEAYELMHYLWTGGQLVTRFVLQAWEFIAELSFIRKYPKYPLKLLL